jgi:hypothetical protein
MSDINKGKYSFIGTILPVLFIGVIILLPLNLFAQDEACGGDDPTGSSTVCPLDTWVWVLIVAAVIFGTISLYRRQKMQTQL